MNSGCIILAHPLCALAGLPSTLMPSDYVWLLSRAWARGNRPSDVRCVEVEKKPGRSAWKSEQSTWNPFIWPWDPRENRENLFWPFFQQLPSPICRLMNFYTFQGLSRIFTAKYVAFKRCPLIKFTFFHVFSRIFPGHLHKLLLRLSCWKKLHILKDFS